AIIDLGNSLCLFYYHSSLHSARRHLDLHSFPTRRSSDLRRLVVDRLQNGASTRAQSAGETFQRSGNRKISEAVGERSRRAEIFRSEEHTSELQSRVDLVCRLLLEKKNSIIDTDVYSCNLV